MTKYYKYTTHRYISVNSHMSRQGSEKVNYNMSQIMNATD